METKSISSYFMPSVANGIKQVKEFEPRVVIYLKDAKERIEGRLINRGSSAHAIVLVGNVLPTERVILVDDIQLIEVIATTHEELERILKNIPNDSIEEVKYE